MKKNHIILLIITTIFLFVSCFYVLGTKGYKIKYTNKEYTFYYDNTWKVIDNTPTTLEHKRSKSTIKMYIKDLENKYIDIPLKEIVNEIRYSIEKQNKEYTLINTVKESNAIYSYLYEYEESNLFLYLYKQDNKLFILAYEADSKYYDIVLDSVESIIESLIIKSGI